MGRRLCCTVYVLVTARRRADIPLNTCAPRRRRILLLYTYTHTYIHTQSLRTFIVPTATGIYIYIYTRLDQHVEPTPVALFIYIYVHLRAAGRTTGRGLCGVVMRPVPKISLYFTLWCVSGYRLDADVLRIISVYLRCCHRRTCLYNNMFYNIII